MRQLTLLLISFLVVGCSTKNEPVVNKNNTIKLSNYSVSFLAGEERIIDVLSEVGDFALCDKNPDIATGWWTNDSKSILIKGENVGKTSIYIKDRSNPDCFAEIKVVSNYLSGDFKENGDSANIIVQAFDKSIQEIIEVDLKAIAKSRTGTLFHFNESAKSISIDYTAAEYEGSNVVGSYEWEKEYLTINANNIINRFRFGTFNAHSITIVLDYLEKYKLKYPDAFITCANLGLFLSSYQQ